MTTNSIINVNTDPVGYFNQLADRIAAEECDNRYKNCDMSNGDGILKVVVMSDETKEKVSKVLHKMLESNNDMSYMLS